MGNVAETYAGLPPGPPRPARGAAQTDEERAAFKKAAAEAAEAGRKWRASAPMSRFEELRKLCNDAGIRIHIAKFSPAAWSDEEIDYSFRAAKALGAKAVCDEIGEEAISVIGNDLCCIALGDRSWPIRCRLAHRTGLLPRVHRLRQEGIRHWLHLRYE